MNQNINFNSQFPVLNTINQVDGFDPSKLTVDYVDLTTQEKRKRLPVMACVVPSAPPRRENRIAC